MLAGCREAVCRHYATSHRGHKHKDFGVGIAEGPGTDPRWKPRDDCIRTWQTSQQPSGPTEFIKDLPR